MRNESRDDSKKYLYSCIECLAVYLAKNNDNVLSSQMFLFLQKYDRANDLVRLYDATLARFPLSKLIL